MKYQTIKKYIFFFLILLCLFPFITAPVALLSGILFALIFQNPFITSTQKLTHKMLQYSVIGLGFGMNSTAAFNAGRTGFIYTIAGISITFSLGWLISKLLKIDKETSILISAGTAICGGSAIAAVSPAINAKNENTTVALGVVFILNSIALVLFPAIGHYLNLSEARFGLWSAIAIHDTSSVVGAAAQYGPTALAVATTVKLARALWIIPVSLISGFAFNSRVQKVKIPYFIFGFILAMLISTFFIQFSSFYKLIYSASRQGLVLTLFLIGTGLTPAVLKKVGIKPLLMGVILWLIVSLLTLLLV